MITIVPTVTLDSNASDIPTPGTGQLFVFFLPDGTLNAKLPDASIVSLSPQPGNGQGSKPVVLPSDWCPGALLSQDTSGNLITVPPGKLGSILRITGAGVLAWSDPATLSQAYGIAEAPSDGHLYGRENDGWTQIPQVPPSSDGIPDAPEDGNLYVRQNGQWVVFTPGASTGGGGGGSTPPPATVATADEFNGTAVDAKWSWINQDGATVSESGGVLTMAAPGRSGDSLNMFLQPVPSGPFSISTSAVLTAQATNYPQGGLVLYNAATGRCCSFVLIWADGAIKPSIDAWNSYTNFNVVVGGFGSPMGAADLRLSVNGDAIQTFYAAVGQPNTTMFQAGSVNSILGGNPTHVGLCVNGSSGQAVSLAFDYFHVTSP